MNSNVKFSLIFAFVGLLVGIAMSFLIKGNMIIDAIIGTLAGAVTGYILNSFVLKK
ncbi:MAG: hypothetical protein IK955_02985 [Clostridia bacterium]|nr:hypothetical protein [Clostridia bacterium]